jgi:Spy/CpxP family protein refolding chaperone
LVNARNLILVVLATVVIFASGVVTGGFLVRQSQPRLPPPPPPGNPPLFAGRFDAVRMATDQINDLTPEQRAKIEKIIRDSRERMADFFLIFEPDIQGVFRKMREDIRAELTPDQRRRMEDIMMRQRQRRMENSGFRPGDRPFPPRRPPWRDGTSAPAPAFPAERPPPDQRPR